MYQNNVHCANDNPYLDLGKIEVESKRNESELTTECIIYIIKRLGFV